MKNALLVVLVIALCCTLAFPATAASSTGNIEPMWNKITMVYAGLEIGDILGIANCSGKITTSVDQPVEVVVNLQQKVNGSWTTIKTWTATGTRSATALGSYAVYRGYEYQVAVVGYLYNSNGYIEESGTAYHTVDFS